MRPQCRLARRVHFSSAHRYYNSKFSEDENKRIFGSCYSPHGHGHNYTLEAYFEGPIDPETGMIINLMTVDELLKDVVAPLDHHHINLDVPEFSDKVPTTENLALYCYNRILERTDELEDVQLEQVRLYEGDDLWVDCFRGGQR